jgi:hypothetical protein
MLLFSLSAKGQTSLTEETGPPAQNVLLGSFGGPGLYFSVIYERHWVSSKKVNLGFRAGLGSSFSSLLFSDEVNVPLGVFLLWGKDKNHLDFSINMTPYLLSQAHLPSREKTRELKVLWVPSIAYRYQPKAGGFVGRIGFSPVFYFNQVSDTLMPWVDISVGWAF